MGKSRSGGASSRPAARSSTPPPRASAPPKAAAPPKPAAPVQHTAAKSGPPAHAPPAHPPAHAPPAAPVSSGGPGLMGTIVASAAGSMAGSVIGHGIANTMFGGRDHGESAPPVAAPPQQSPCSAFYTQFTDCLNQNNNNISECQFQFDKFQSCQRDGKSDTYA